MDDVYFPSVPTGTTIDAIGIFSPRQVFLVVDGGPVEVYGEAEEDGDDMDDSGILSLEEIMDRHHTLLMANEAKPVRDEKAHELLNYIGTLGGWVKTLRQEIETLEQENEGYLYKVIGLEDELGRASMGDDW